MPKRKHIPNEVETEVIFLSARRCCICLGLSGDFTEKQGQIAHLDRDPSNSELDNLAWLCLAHHDKYDGKTSQSKGFTISEVKRYRTLLYQKVKEELRNRQESSHSPVNVRIEPFLRSGEGYVSLKIHNDGYQTLRCYAYLTKLIYISSPTERLDIKDRVNPGQSRLSWHGGSPNGEKDVELRALPAILNIAYQFGNDIVFTFQEGNKKAHGQHFEIEVELRAESDGKYISTFKWEGCIDQAPTINIRACVHGNSEERTS